MEAEARGEARDLGCWTAGANGGTEQVWGQAATWHIRITCLPPMPLPLPVAWRVRRAVTALRPTCAAWAVEPQGASRVCQLRGWWVVAVARHRRPQHTRCLLCTEEGWGRGDRSLAVSRAALWANSEPIAGWIWPADLVLTCLH